jgi:FtsZ-binding cell division protein ZapB
LETSPLEVLEAKVSQVMERISTLRAENEELRKVNQDLEARCRDLEKALDETKRSLTTLEKERAGWMSAQKDKEEKIRAKVSSLLEKLEGIEQ